MGCLDSLGNIGIVRFDCFYHFPYVLTQALSGALSGRS